MKKIIFICAYAFICVVSFQAQSQEDCDGLCKDVLDSIDNYKVCVKDKKILQTGLREITGVKRQSLSQSCKQTILSMQSEYPVDLFILPDPDESQRREMDQTNSVKIAFHMRDKFIDVSSDPIMSGISLANSTRVLGIAPNGNVARATFIKDTIAMQRANYTFKNMSQDVSKVLKDCGEPVPAKSDCEDEFNVHFARQILFMDNIGFNVNFWLDLSQNYLKTMSH